MKKGTIKLLLSAEPQLLTMPERKNFKISLAATNQGGEIVDPQLHRAKLLVNGKESKVWSLAIGNGKREAQWSALPPGETVSMTWSSMGESLLTHPGVFTLTLSFGEIQLDPIQVQVLAE
jgi:hypothetical protein